MKSYLFLFLAILFETVATSFMKQSEQFTKLVPSVVTIVGYIGAFYCLSLVLKTIPVSIAYAIWSGVGLSLLRLSGWWSLSSIWIWRLLSGSVLLSRV